MAVLENLAESCLSVGAYQIAAKKFTQAGNTVKVKRNKKQSSALTMSDYCIY